MASIVGEATITLSFDGKELTAQLQETENKFRNKGTTSGQIWGNAWTVAAGNLISKGIGKIVDSISSNLDSAIKRVDTIANSNKVFTAMGYAADDVSVSMDSLTSYLDGLPTSMTTAVSAVQSLSASFGGIEKGTQTFIDMNNAGLAFGATSDQIENAIMQLGQLSLDGPLDAQTWNSLRNSGFSPVFAAMAKEAGITVGELKEQFGGNGSKTVGDFLDQLHKLNTEGGGDMDSLANLAKANTNGIGTAIENVQNRISKAIAKVIDHIGQENISGMINDISKRFSEVADVVIKIIDFLSANKWILEFLGTFVGIAIAIGAAIWVINAAMAANPITWIIIAVAALIAGIVMLIKHAKEVGAWFSKIGQAIGSFFQSVADKIGEVLTQIGEFFTDIWNKVVQFFTDVWNKVVQFFTMVGQKIAQAAMFVWNTFLKPVVDFYRNVSIAILAILATIVQWIWEKIVGAAQWIWGTFFQPIINFWTTVITAIRQGILDMVESIKTFATSVVAWIQANVIEPIKNFFVETWQNIVEGVKTATSAIKGVFQLVVDWIRTNVIEPIGKFFSMLWEGVKSGAKALGEGVKNAMLAVANAIKAPINAIIDAINSVIDGINSLTVPDWVPGIGGQHPNFGHIPRLAQGGVVDSATAALIGEAGKEAVIPLERNTENWTAPLAKALAEQFESEGISTAGHITVNMNNYINNNLDADEIGQRLMTSIRRAA